MKFETPAAVNAVVWDLKLADLPRDTNRGLINQLYNGEPPYTPDEQRERNINTNVNFLEGTKLAHDARRQFTNAFLKPGYFFNVNVQYGKPHKRREWSSIISKEINRRMKRSLRYLEILRSTFANVVLHGIGPVNWSNRMDWIPDAIGVEDVLIPSGTYLTMENLQFFAIFRQYTPKQLWDMTHGPKVDKGWNVPMAESAIKNASESTTASIAYAELYSPSKIAERFKQDGGLWASDIVPTIDCWDFYFYNDQSKESGWNRRVILDYPLDATTDKKTKPNFTDSFLFDPGDRVYANKLSEILHFQFGDASAVAPFRYHSVRSLGWLLYSVCHLQNRLRCKLNDHAFESLMWYFRVNNPDDRDRLQKVDLTNLGIIPEGLDFVKAQDRYFAPSQLVEMIMGLNRQSMADNSASYTQDYNYGSEKTDETATATMARVNSANALVSSMLTDAYNYQQFQYEEICRRFCLKNSENEDAKAFRLCCVRQGVPEAALDQAQWDIDPVRVLGSGNKMLELMQAKELMAARPLFDPEPQRRILHLFTASTTDDPALAEELVPIKGKQVSDATHDAQMSVGSLLRGVTMALKEGVSHAEYAEALLAALAQEITKIEQRGGMASPEEITGLQNLAGVTVDGQPIPGNGIAAHIQIVAQDESEKARVKQYQDDLKNLMNYVKAYVQRLQEQQQKQAGDNGGGDNAETMAKIQAQKMQAEAKAANTRESHAQRTAQRQIQWEAEQRRKEDEHQAKMRQQAEQTQVDLTSQAVQTAADIRQQGMKTMLENKTTEQKKK